MYSNPSAELLQAITWWDTKTAQCDWRISGLSHYESRQMIEHFPDDLRHASVLLLVRAGRIEPEVILTRRSETLRSHASLWSLPGGKTDINDVNELDTALRETSEELGISRDAISVLGRLPDHILIESQYCLAVFIGLLADNVALKKNNEEVAEVMGLPMSVLLDTRSRIRRKRTLGSLVFPVEDIIYKKERIWGATAGVLVTLGKLLSGAYLDKGRR